MKKTILLMVAILSSYIVFSQSTGRKYDGTVRNLGVMRSATIATEDTTKRYILPLDKNGHEANLVLTKIDGEGNTVFKRQELSQVYIDSITQALWDSLYSHILDSISSLIIAAGNDSIGPLAWLHSNDGDANTYLTHEDNVSVGDTLFRYAPAKLTVFSNLRDSLRTLGAFGILNWARDFGEGRGRGRWYGGDTSMWINFAGEYMNRIFVDSLSENVYSILQLTGRMNEKGYPNNLLPTTRKSSFAGFEYFNYNQGIGDKETNYYSAIGLFKDNPTMVFKDRSGDPFFKEHKIELNDDGILVDGRTWHNNLSNGEPAYALGIDGSNEMIQFAVPSGGSSLTVPISRILYVDSRSGNNTTARKGDILKPFLTIGAAIDSANNGDLVYVMPGTYTEEIISTSSVFDDLGFNMCRKSNGTFFSDIKYYFCAGARIVKDGGGPILVPSNLSCRVTVDGSGTFWKKSISGANSGGKYVAINCGTSTFVLNFSCDTLLNSVGSCIVSSYVGNKNVFNVRTTISNGGDAAISGEAINYKGYVKSTTGTAVTLFSNTAYGTSVIEGEFISTASGKAAVQLNGRGYVKIVGNVYANATDGYGIMTGYLSNGAFYVANDLRADVEIHRFDCKYLLRNHGTGYNYSRANSVVNLRMSGTYLAEYFRIHTYGGVVNLEGDIQCPGSIKVYGGLVNLNGTWDCGGDVMGYYIEPTIQINDTITSEYNYLAHDIGKFVINGRMDYRRQPYVTGTGSLERHPVSYIRENGILEINGVLNVTGAHGSGDSLRSPFMIGGIKNIGRVATLILGSNSVVIDSSNSLSTFTFVGRGTRLISRGGILQKITGYSPMRIWNYDMSRGTLPLASGKDSVFCEVYGYANFHTNKNVEAQPIAIGTKDFNGGGFDWSADNSSFVVNVSGTPKTVTLNQNTANFTELITYLNSRFDAAGAPLQAYRVWNSNQVRIRIKYGSISTPYSDSHFTFTSGDGLVDLGLTSGVKYGASFQSKMPYIGYFYMQDAGVFYPETRW